MSYKIAYLGPEGTYSHAAARKFAQLLSCMEGDGAKSSSARNAGALDHSACVENASAKNSAAGATQTKIEFMPCATFDEVFEFVDRGRVSAGVVPIENSLEGAVTSTLDNFAFTSNAQILAEVVLDIHHCLVVHACAELKDITQISSHAQGLAQCRRYINAKFPGVALHTTHSTAQSAKQAAENKNVAGIANKLSAQLYGARVLEENIEDNMGNQTKFALIARPGSDVASKFEAKFDADKIEKIRAALNIASPSAAHGDKAAEAREDAEDAVTNNEDAEAREAANAASSSEATDAAKDARLFAKPPTYKTSLALFLQTDRVGALLMILEEFAYANVNLTMLQSRPTKQALGDYMFFIDLEGEITSPHIQTALNCLRLKLREVKVLGCYPVWT